MSADTSENTGQADQPDDETLRRRSLFDAYWTEQQTRERANADKYDNTILAYSTGALGLSVTFIKDLVPLADAQALWAIKTSWVLFAASLLLMLASFPIAGKANRQSVESAHEYFINRKNDYYNKDRWAAKILRWLNPFAGFVFFVATGFTIAFVWMNVHDKEHTVMTEPKVTHVASTQLLVTEGIGSASMQVVHKGTPSAAMPAAAAAPATQAQAPAQAEAPAPTPPSE